VVLEGVVGRRHGDAGPGGERENELGHGGRRDDPGVRGFCARASDPLGQLREQPWRGEARVAPQDDLAAGEAAHFFADEPGAERVERKGAGLPAQSVGSEELHRRPSRRIGRGVGSGRAAGRSRTPTVTTCPSRTRTPGASVRTVAGIEKLAARSARDIGSVSTTVIFASAEAGPKRRATRGSTVTSSSSNPSAGFPVRVAAIGRLFSAAASSATRTSEGAMEIASTSGGTLTSSGARRSLLS